jgi:hypothetical protein
MSTYDQWLHQVASLKMLIKNDGWIKMMAEMLQSFFETTFFHNTFFPSTTKISVLIIRYSKFAA